MVAPSPSRKNPTFSNSRTPAPSTSRVSLAGRLIRGRRRSATRPSGNSARPTSARERARSSDFINCRYPPGRAAMRWIRLRADSLPDKALHFLAVGAALGLAHDRPHQRADRLLVARPDLLDGVRVGLDGARDDRLELVIAGHRHAAVVHDLRGVAPLLHEHAEHFLGVRLRHALGLDHANELS